MQLDVESLRTFTTVLDEGSMTAAAGRLSMSQSAISWKIKRLEERLGRELFVREGRSLRLSKDGEELVEYARAIVGLHDEAVIRMSSTELTGHVRIGANEEISASRMADLLARFDRLHPRARIEFHVQQSLVLARRIDVGELDVAVFLIEPDQVRPRDEVLWSEELAWAVGAGTVVDAEPIPLVSYGDDCCFRPIAWRVLDEAGVVRRHAFSGHSTASVEAATAAGLGVSVVARRRLGEDIVEWQPPVELPPLPDMCQVIRHAKGAVSPIVRALANELATELIAPA